MKILFLNYEYPPLGGGAGNATYYILRELSKAGNLEIDLVTSSIGGSRVEKTGGITIHYLDILKKSDPHHQSIKDLIFYSIKAYFYSKKLIRENNYDLTHSFFSVPCGFLSWLFFKRYKIPYIVSLRGADVPGYADRFSRMYKILKPLIKKIWKDSSGVIANSEGLKELAQKSSENQSIGVIGNGIDADEFSPNPSAKNKSEFIITPGASRITSRKGLKYLIEAMKILSEKYPNILLKIMGEGSEKKDLKKLVENLALEGKVEFVGAVPHEKTARYYQESDVFVLPSFNEGMSNAMLEALACGLPIITTNTGGAKELVREGENGFYVKMENSQDIAGKIEKLILNPELRNKMSLASRTIAEKMSWENAASQYFKIYQSVISDPFSKRAVSKLKTFIFDKKVKLAVKFAAMLGFISWIVYKVNWSEVLDYLKRVEIWYLLVFALIFSFGILLSAYKWKILADFKNIPETLPNFYKIYLTGAFLNNFFPSIIGGDTYRSYTLGKIGEKKYIAAASTVMADRITGFIGVMILILVFSLLNFNAVLRNPILIVINLLIIASLGIDFLLMIIRRLPIWNFAKRFIPEIIIKLIQEVRSYSANYRVLGRAVFWGVIYNFIGVGIANWFLFKGFGIPIGFSEYMICISVVSIISSIPISIGNIGIKEWGYFTFFGIFGVSGEAAISVAILGRFLQMFVSFFAIPFYLKERKKDYSSDL